MKYWLSALVVLWGGILLSAFIGEKNIYSGTNEESDKSPNILFVISDDQSWPHASAYGTPEINTPAFDQVAREGVLFTNAFAGAPQCSPNRAAILTGRNIWELEEAGTHASNFPKKFQVFPDLLESAGYQIGYTGKGWGPGNWRYNDRSRNPAGPEYKDVLLQNKPSLSVSEVNYAANFREFLDSREPGKPFFFWVGTHEPHRGYKKGSGIKAGKNPDNVKVPSFLPDAPQIRSDILDYFLEIEWFDHHLKQMLDLLKKRGALDNTLVVVTSDNGMPFPRAKANLYEYGTHVPLAISWPNEIPKGRVVHDLTSSIDFAPTFLQVAGVEIPEQTTGSSLLNILKSDSSGQVDTSRKVVLTGRERHTHARPENLGYPSRSIRTQRYLYIRNPKPERWPAGNPSDSGDPPHYHDIDDSPSKAYMLKDKDKPRAHELFHLGFQKRPKEELYDIQKDPGCIINLAENPEYASLRSHLSTKLDSILKAQNDPRAYGYEIFESYPRYSHMRDFEGFKTQGEYNFEY
ncbi:sulfatase [Aliifodinibius sp. S!AR15-10]|uniref:sulfatase family protein n=1 Tax=Aliifodinibius sp. S!AR15-10 TaxID=2950437 RepID=UPI0028564068|nr:sulfatase [Aliifodinibius sp. S!AR15-10]MDR8389915.1 sulfatase [Aliifodinibius sp. S!AR15-10]